MLEQLITGFEAAFTFTNILCIAAGISDELTAALSNLAGGIVCEQVGVVPIDKDLLFGEAMELKVASGY